MDKTSKKPEILRDSSTKVFASPENSYCYLCKPLLRENPSQNILNNNGRHLPMCPNSSYHLDVGHIEGFWGDIWSCTRYCMLA